MQEWSTVLRAVEAGSRLALSGAVRRVRIGVILRNRRLAFCQYIYSKTFLRMQVSVCSRLLIDANQHQQGIQRYRGECVGSHAVNFAFAVDSDDRAPVAKLAIALRNSVCVTAMKDSCLG